MEIFGTNFAITLGSWRLRFCVALEDVDAPMPVRQAPPHRMRVVSESDYAANRRASSN